MRESIGLKEDRGDQLNVLNQTFKRQRARSRPVEGPPIWETPWVTQLAKQIVGAGARAAGGVPDAAAADEVAHQAVFAAEFAPTPAIWPTIA